MQTRGDQKKRKLNQSITGTEPAKRRRDILAMRTDNSQLVEKPDGSTTPLKTAVLIDGSQVTPEKQPSLQANLNDAFAQSIPSYRPVQTVMSELGSPKAVGTPRGSRLSLAANYGNMRLFTNKPKSKKCLIEEIDKSHKFFSSPTYAAIVAAQNSFKSQSVTVTPALLSETQTKYAQSGFRRTVSQNQVMAAASAKAASATKYAKAAEVFANVDWEWLHMVAYAISGESTQNKENIVAGTQYANTDMMMIEAQKDLLAEKYPEGFTLEVHADLIPGTHFAKTIRYNIEAGSFRLSLQFDAQNTEKPHRSYLDYMRIFVSNLIDSKQNAVSSSSDSHDTILFYNKSGSSLSR